MIEQSPTLTQLYTALAKAQGQMTHAEKGNANPRLNSKYASLADVWDAIRKPLSDNGLSVLQFPIATETPQIALVTRLCHESGEYVQSVLRAPSMPANPAINPLQLIGVETTYLRRYALMSIVGIAPDDDDGEGAGYLPAQKPTPTTKPVPVPKKQEEPAQSKISEQKQEWLDAQAKLGATWKSANLEKGAERWAKWGKITGKELKENEWDKLTTDDLKALTKYAQEQSAIAPAEEEPLDPFAGLPDDEPVPDGLLMDVTAQDKHLKAIAG